MSGKIKWGIHPDINKKKTLKKSIENGTLPNKVVIPVRQHIGVPCVPTVKTGDQVKKGQLIAAGNAAVSSNIHASISGTVSEIINKPHPVYGECLSIVIESDGKDQWEEGILTERDWKQLDKSEIVQIIKNAGIVGMGGAAFPSHIKLIPPKNKKIDILVINAAECEPFLTVDHRVMLEHAAEVAEGVRIIAEILSVENVVIGIEDNKMDAVAALRDMFSESMVKVVPVPTRYPQGAEKMIIKTLLNREVAPGKLPMDVGVVVQNVSTALAIHNAVVKGIPLIERVVTVSGGAIKEPKNLMLRIGTTFADAINQCGGLIHTPEKVVMGGPMMGLTQYTTDVPLIKGTSGILALWKKDIKARMEASCIRCGKCVSSCPMGLNPGMISVFGEKELYEEAINDYHMYNCLECGCCSFVCPAKRNIVHYIRYLKKLSADSAAAAKGGK